jgi:hypothetical protein
MVIFRAHAWFVAAVCLLSTPDANTATVVGIVSDGPQVRQLIPIEAIEAEIAVLTGDEFDVRLPAVKRRDGGWTRDGIRVALQQLLEDRDVDIVVCLGLLSCNEVASLPNLPKPVIAPVVVDPKLQGFPLRGAASGKPNFVYITNFNTVDDDLQVFQKAVGFEQLAILADSTSMEAMGRFRDRKREQLAADLGVQITVVPVRDTLDGVIAEIPSGIDAVYVTPLPRFDAENLRQLAGTLIERKLPSFSLLGVTEVAQGLLMANGGRQQDMLRLARRIALNIHSILLGNRALQQTRRLAINMRTAEAIGYFPRYAIVSDAELLFAEELEAGIPLGLVEAMKDAVEANATAAGTDRRGLDADRRGSCQSAISVRKEYRCRHHRPAAHLFRRRLGGIPDLAIPEECDGRELPGCGSRYPAGVRTDLSRSSTCDRPGTYSAIQSGTDADEPGTRARARVHRFLRTRRRTALGEPDCPRPQELDRRGSIPPPGCQPPQSGSSPATGRTH